MQSTKYEIINKVLNNLRTKLIKEIDTNIEAVLLFAQGYYTAVDTLNQEQIKNIQPKELNCGL